MATWAARSGGGSLAPMPTARSGIAAAVLEVGDLRGTGAIVYFVPDAKRLSRLTGCTLPVGTQDPACGPDDPYRVAWTVSGDKLILSQVAGSRGGNIGTWRKIA